MISGLAPPRGIAGEAASQRLAFEPCCCWELRRSHRNRRALKVVDLARVKINQPQPWTPATLRLNWSQRTDVPRIVLLPGASAGLGRVSGVAAFRRPGLVAVLAVVP